MRLVEIINGITKNYTIHFKISLKSFFRCFIIRTFNNYQKFKLLFSDKSEPEMSLLPIKRTTVTPMPASVASSFTITTPIVTLTKIAGKNSNQSVPSLAHKSNAIITSTKSNNPIINNLQYSLNNYKQQQCHQTKPAYLLTLFSANSAPLYSSHTAPPVSLSHYSSHSIHS